MPTINFRMSEEQHAELQASAKQSGRSIQRELEWRAFTHYSATKFLGSDPVRAQRILSGAAPGEAWEPAASGTFREVTDAVAELEVAAPVSPSSPSGDAPHEVGVAATSEAADEEATPPTPSVPDPPAPAARSQRLRRPKNGPCQHRVPEGTYCKQCGA
jgi:hypothetical protein